MAINDDFRGEEEEEEENPRTCVVLFGRSFIGRSLVSMLLKSDNWIVRIVDSASSLNLDVDEKDYLLSEAISSGRALYFQVDVRDKSQLTRAIEGSSVVFHLDASDSSTRDFYHQYTITVQGTKNVISACKECKVKRLVYNSSADVVFDGMHDIHNGDESLPYPLRFEDMLSDLKAQAEALVLFASSYNGLLTCALRPSNAYGPGDPCLIPFFISVAKYGLAKFIVGNGKNMCDFTYVDNIAHAHLCAEEVLRSKMASVVGKAFFITNLEPVKSWDFVSLIWEGLGYPSPTIQLPARLVWFITVLLHWVCEKLGYQRFAHSIPSPATVHLLSCTRTFNCRNAQDLMGYSPVVSLEEGVALTIKSFSHSQEGSFYMRCHDLSEPSKVDKLLGSGRVADILLWRNEKKTFIYFLGLVFLLYWFFLSGRTVVSSAANLLLLISVILLVHGILPASFRYNFTIQKIPPSEFEVSETVVKDVSKSLVSAWNQCMRTLKLVAQGGDWNSFIKVALSLYFSKLLLTIPCSAVIGTALIFAFTAFFIYEQYEDEVDRLTEASFLGIKRLTASVMKTMPVAVASLVHIH